MSYKPEIQTMHDEKYYPNATCFATYDEAKSAAQDIYSRWLLATDWRVVESTDPVNYRIKDGVMEPVNINGLTDAEESEEVA